MMGFIEQAGPIFSEVRARLAGGTKLTHRSANTRLVRPDWRTKRTGPRASEKNNTQCQSFASFSQ